MNLKFSIIIPVYNRPDELDELLSSIVSQHFKEDLEVVVVEDGSNLTAKHIIDGFKDKLNIHYLKKDNSGPGLSRNFGMQHACGNYFIILDSDCILPKNYLKEVSQTLLKNFTDAFGGSDASHDLFTSIQKAINYAMTSVLTTGGLRGNKNLKKFQPRSFNMGLSKKAFEKTGGFSPLRYGEDIDLTFRLWVNGFETQFIENAYVYHKRRVSWSSFFKQTFNFGAARPILNKLHPNTAKITYWFPSVFVVVFLLSAVGSLFHFNWLIYCISIYFLLIFFDSLIKNKNIIVAFLSICATLVMFFGYGLGFLRSTIRLLVGKSPKEAFPKMFS
ncbi:glycosyltransferase [Aureibaculum sp. 2210JD6-5]|uniref:glycosyltransferase n=1 Tax=Aureibaculum sp. 2210JD6-5 TaxID=3103957 RepID=UPI002AAD4740|nr:glycosyltransferase [Aureibaculum sp. 2210JD6-5]MDY7395492.1 glycosyltransferase [Aureibaculum sp. 2210JD6-5]